MATKATRSRRILRLIAFAFAGFVVLILGVRFTFGRLLNTGGPPAGAIEKVTTSKDGTKIAYEQTGTGPVIVNPDHSSFKTISNITTSGDDELRKPHKPPSDWTFYKR